MTTIATDGETIAADGLVTSGGTIFGWNAEKLHRLPDGRIVGLCGAATYIEPFLAFLCEGEALDIGEDFEALVLHPDGSVLSYDHKGRSLAEELPTASGSGREIALGAMVAGASPREAVEIAAQRDTSTGGTITEMSRPRRAKLRRAA